MLVAYLQFYPEKGNIKNNLEKIESMIDDTEFDILVLPELATTGYFFVNKEEIKDLAEEAGNGVSFKHFKRIAKKKNSLVIYGFAERENQIYYNSQAAIFPDGNYIIYRKTHLFYKEKMVYQPGNTGPVVVEFKGAKIGLMICFDWFFPEFSRILALKGAQILAHSANLVLPGMAQKGMVVRSMENRVFSITANRIGEENSSEGEKLLFTGMSQIVNPSGEVLTSSERDTEELKTVEIEPKEADNKNITALNNIFTDRRIDIYRDILEK